VAARRSKWSDGPDRRHAACGRAGVRQGVATRAEREVAERAGWDSAGTLGAMLRAHRISCGLTQGELSRRAGVSVRAVRDIERGRVRQPRRESVERLAAALGLALTGVVSLSAGLPAGSPAGRQRSRAGRADLEIGVLGPLVVRRAGMPVDAGPMQQRCLLGLLALQPNQVVGREEIVDVLWGASPPATHRDLVHAYVARLRKLLAPRQQRGAPVRMIARVNSGYQLTVDTDQLDLLRFGELAAQAHALRAEDPAAARELFAQALACWRRPVLADLTVRLRQHPAAVALSQQRLAVVLACADLALDSGHYQQAELQLRELVHEEPLHEGLHARRMLALAGSGQQAAALELFTRLRSRLVEELGVEPGAELQDAQARVLRGDLPIAGRSDEHSTMGGSAERPPAQLPADVVGFTGRAEHLERLDALLAGASAAPATVVVSAALTGTAGVGKTALAVHWAHRIARSFGDGQLYVDLQGYGPGPPLPPLQALAGLLRGLGVQAHKVPVELGEAANLYRSLLAGRRMLVVLDNARDAEQVRPLLPGSPGCLVVVTSRDRLTGLVATHGVQRLALDVLTPTEAAALLSQMLGEKRVAAEPEAAMELTRVCGWLPLALRIAAANLAGQPGRSIAGYLAELQGADRLAELAVDGDPRAAVLTAFGHSYQQLSPDSRRLFRLLGLVPGPRVSVQAAAALAGSTPPQARRLLGRLLDAHLLEQRAPGRYGLHDLLRLYARQRAERDCGPSERDAALGRLLDWYLRTTDSAARLLYPGMLRLPLGSRPGGDTASAAGFADAATAVAWLDAERANLVAAVQHAAEHGPQLAAWLLADALRGYFWLRRWTVEWAVAAGAGLAAAERAGDLPAQAAGQLSLGGASQTMGNHPQAVHHYTRALTLARQAGWTDGHANALSNLGVVHWWSGNLRQAADHHAQALTLSRQTGRLGGQANTLLNLGLVQRDLGRLQEAAGHQTQAVALHRQLGARDGEAHALAALGEIDHDLGYLDRALEHLTHALTLHQELGDRFGLAQVMCTLAAVHRDAGRYRQGLELAQAALRTAAEVGHSPTEARARSTLASIHGHLGDTEAALGQHQQALELARQTATSAVEIGALLGLAETYQQTGRHARAVDRAELACRSAHRSGFGVLEGQAHTVLAAAHHRLGDHEQALAHAELALASHRRSGHRLGQARTLRVLGDVLADHDGVQTAAACWRKAVQLLTEIGNPEADRIRALLAT
jgi:DNA-binding SARP family transcriptional activator/tetratricopeptide (TPR) repeat protein/DNA-binding XRE family transcriptional regulator